ncbi:hypothetical protein HK102_001314 [Quaeritorhiza haematococci]|nr:hypothetical protein HK102_001314 [Quaeritorhiza haematococci]
MALPLNRRLTRTFGFLALIALLGLVSTSFAQSAGRPPHTLSKRTPLQDKRDDILKRLDSNSVISALIDEAVSITEATCQKDTTKTLEFLQQVRKELFTIPTGILKDANKEDGEGGAVETVATIGYSVKAILDQFVDHPRYCFMDAVRRRVSVPDIADSKCGLPLSHPIL